MLLIIMYWGKPKINLFYYVDTSVLLENIPLVTFIKTTSGTWVGLFSIISHVSLLMM